MLSTGGVLLFGAAIAFASAHARAIGLCLAVLATVMLVIALGPVGGLVLAAVAAMGAGSVLALALRPTPDARRPRPLRRASGPRSSLPGHSATRTLALVVGAPLAAIALGAVLIAVAPCEPPLAFAIGTHTILPGWVALACLLPLARDGLRAWAWCAGLLLAAWAAMVIP